MSTSESHSVRNGVIATVVGGIAMAALGELWPPAKKAGVWLWDQAIWLISFFTDVYTIKGWFLAILLLLALITIIRLIIGFKTQKTTIPAFANYTDDSFYSAKWRWAWLSGQISSLWCYCPRCDSELVYDDSSCRSIYSDVVRKTDFICEHCNRYTVASIEGGNKSYALSAVERQIRRKIRTNEYS